MAPPTPRTGDNASWLVIAAMAATCAGLAWREGLRIDPWRALPVGAVLLILAGVMLAGINRPRLSAAATAFLQMTLFTVIGVVLAYAVAAGAGELWDARLAAADRALGLDWPAIHRALDGWPGAIWVLGIAYHGLTVQMVVMIVALADAGAIGRLRRTVAAAVTAGFATILISGIVPAAGNLVDPADYRHLWPSVAWWDRALITGLRDGTLTSLDLTSLRGIVSFPSFHATLAAIFIWAARGLGRLAWPMRVWAALIIAGTPVFGGHYGVDVIAGVALAWPAIAASKWLVRGQASAASIAAAASAAPSTPAIDAPSRAAASR